MCKTFSSSVFWRNLWRHLTAWHKLYHTCNAHYAHLFWKCHSFHFTYWKLNNMHIGYLVVAEKYKQWHIMFSLMFEFICCQGMWYCEGFLDLVGTDVELKYKHLSWCISDLKKSFFHQPHWSWCISHWQDLGLCDIYKMGIA